MACSARGQDESKSCAVIGYPSGQDRPILTAQSGPPAVSLKKNFPVSHITNPLLTKVARSRWLDTGLVLFCVFMDRNGVEVHKLAKKDLGQYPAILTSHLPWVKKESPWHPGYLTLGQKPIYIRPYGMLVQRKLFFIFCQVAPTIIRGLNL